MNFTKINSVNGFASWALNTYGTEWPLNKKIQNTYGISQLKKLFPIYFRNIPDDTPESSGILDLNIFRIPNFKKLDVIQDKEFIDRAISESKLIYSKESTHNGRTIEEIFENVKQGHIGEMFLIRNCGFSDIKEPFMDVLSPDGKVVDVKCYKNEKNIPLAIEHLRDRQSYTYIHTDYAIFFIIENEDYNYNCTVKI